MGLSFQTYVLGGCATSKPSIIPGSIKTFNVSLKPVLTSKPKETPAPSQTPAFDPLLRPAGLMRQSVPVVMESDKTGKMGRQDTPPLVVSKPEPVVEVETEKVEEIEKEEIQPEEPESHPENSLSEQNAPSSKDFIKSTVLTGIESAIECLEDQVRLKTFSEVGMMRALDTLERVKDLLLRELLTNK